MNLHFHRGPALKMIIPPVAEARAAAPQATGKPGDCAKAQTTAGITDGLVVTTPARAADFSSGSLPSSRPDDAMPSRVTSTMLGIYRKKYQLDVGAVVFKDIRNRAAAVRAWCDSLAPGTCEFALGSTANGIHTFALAVGRSADGIARCLLVDGMGVCIHRVVDELTRAFDDKLYVTPQIQRAHQLGCIVFAMRFLLLSRAPGLADKVLKSLEDFEIQYRDDMPAVRQLGLDDTWRMAGWLAGTQLRQDIPKEDFLRKLPLNNGGQHAKWSIDQFFESRPYTLTTDVRSMYREVDLLVNDPSRSLVSAERRAYLQKRFLQYAEPLNAA